MQRGGVEKNENITQNPLPPSYPISKKVGDRDMGRPAKTERTKKIIAMLPHYENNVIAKKCGVSPAWVTILRRKHGVPHPEEVRQKALSGQIAELAAQGLSRAEVAKKLGVMEVSVSKISFRDGIVWFTDGVPRKFDLDALKTFMAEGHSFREAAHYFGVSKSCIGFWCRRYGIRSIADCDGFEQNTFFQNAEKAEKLLELLFTGVPTMEIVRELKCSPITIQQYAEAEGICLNFRTRAHSILPAVMNILKEVESGKPIDEILAVYGLNRKTYELWKRYKN